MSQQWEVNINTTPENVPIFIKFNAGITNNDLEW